MVVEAHDKVSNLPAHAGFHYTGNVVPFIKRNGIDQFVSPVIGIVGLS